MSNIIQFPLKKREVTTPSQDATVPPPVPTTPPPPKGKKQKAMLGGVAFAIMLATIASNRFTFEAAKMQTTTASSVEGARSIASIGSGEWKRDAQWEKQIAESLASAGVRSVASTHIGRPATLEEQLRFGVLDDVKYSFSKPDATLIQSITFLQDGSEPNYVPDRRQFLNVFGSLLARSFASAQLKSVEVSDKSTDELYELYGKDQRPVGVAHITIDRYQRLLSLKVEPVQI